MFYLVVTKVGCYVSLSQVATEARCRPLGARRSDIIVCPNIRDVENCLFSARKDYEPVELLIGRLTYWTPIRCRALVDLKAGRTYICYSNGSVHLELQDGTNYDYKICQGELLTDKKTVRELRKLKYIECYDFDCQKTVKIALA